MCIRDRSEEQFIATMFQDGRSVDASALRAFLGQSYRWVDGMEALLQDLIARGHELHAMSNYPVWYRLIEEELGLSRYLSWTFVSWDQGLRKPDRRAFTRLESLLGIPGNALTLVDDQPRNIAAARSAGWSALHFTDAPTLREALGLPS